MVSSPQTTDISPEQYLKLEQESEVKHEYINGKLYAMAGASDTHVTIALNLATDLRNYLRGSDCRVYFSDMKLKINALNRFYYPDIFITCDTKDQETSLYKQFPCLIIEVLSDSTEAFDRGDKFADYQMIETLQEYLLINTRQKRLDYFRRTTEGSWLYQAYRNNNQPFVLQTINFEGNLNRVYEDVNL